MPISSALLINKIIIFRSLYHMKYQYIKKEYRPAFLALILMLMHFISAYPGGMTGDSFDQYRQSLNHNFFSHHPPLMAMVWALFNCISQGPQLMLLLHLAFLWGGVALLFYADETNKYRKLYFIIPFIPLVLSQSGTVWKDVGFSFSIFFLLSAGIFYSYRPQRASIPVIIGLLIVGFYSVGVKFQAQFIIPVVIYFILSAYLKRNVLMRLLACGIASFLIIGGNVLLINSFSVNARSEQLRQFFDIAGISVRVNDDSLFPEYIRKSPIYSFNKVKSAYTEKWVDTLFYMPKTKVFERTLDEDKLKEMNSAFLKAVVKHPIAYLQHRGSNFLCNMLASNFKNYALVEEKEQAKELNIPTLRHNVLRSIMKRILGVFPAILTTNMVSLLMIGVYLIHIIRQARFPSVELNILKYIVLICMIFSLTLFFTTMASDYRYYYVVRILSLFSLPIYLKSMLKSQA